jgi:hypothetical protein
MDFGSVDIDIDRTYDCFRSIADREITFDYSVILGKKERNRRAL